MKRLLVPLVTLLILAIIMTGCSSTKTTTAAPPSSSAPTTTMFTPASPIVPISSATNPATSTAAPPVSSTTVPPSSTSTGETPLYGGVMRVVLTSGPANIGYFPTQTFQDETYAPTWSDRLFDLDNQGNLVPNLCLSYEYPADSTVMTLHLRPNVKFQDGTPFNAAAVKWTIDEGIKTNAMPGAANIASVEAVDAVTLKVNVKKHSSMTPFNLWRPTYYSPTAFQQKGKDWAALNSVSTGAFKETNFQPNNILEMSKWDGYWRSGKPYLDTVQIRTVADSSTCMALVQSSQTDLWCNATFPEAAQLKKAGYEILSGNNTLNDIFPDSKDPTSPFAKKEVREALEYALDKTAINDSLSYGFGQPVTMMAPPGTAGYNPDFKGRPYNVAKAKELMKAAGYEKGFKTTMMYTTAGNAKYLAAAVQGYLKEIGIDVTLDPADPGRYWGSIFTTGWHGLLLGVHAINPQWAVAWLDHFGPEALIGFVSMAKSQAFIDSGYAVNASPDLATFKKNTMLNVTQAGEDCMFIPINNTPMLVIKQKWAHTTYTTALDWTGWTLWDDWVSKH